MLSGEFKMSARQYWFLITVMFVFSLSACEYNQKKGMESNMNKLSPRLQAIFEKSKSVCFGRFIVDVPENATVVWGESLVPLDVIIYPNGKDIVEKSAGDFIDELKSEKAINHNDATMFLSVDEVLNPEGKIVVGYESFQSINGLKINGYFKIGGDGVVIKSLPMRAQKEEAIALIKSTARRLISRVDDDVPELPGNCIEYGFLRDENNPKMEDLTEHIQIGFRLKDFPDSHFSIYIAPANPDDSDRDSLKVQFDRIKADMAASRESMRVLATTKFFRESARQIHDWQTGYEVLIRSPDEKGSHAHHDFQAKFIGVPHDPYRPYADIQFQTGVADNAAGATKASLTDEEALAVWDKITSSIRVRPTVDVPNKHAQTDPEPRLPLGELAATGRTCPQTGWWQADEAGPVEGGARRYIKAGERMPHVIALGEPSLWQKLKKERPSYRSGTVWKLVSHDDAPTQPHVMASAASAATGAVDARAAASAPGHPADDLNGTTPPDNKS